MRVPNLNKIRNNKANLDTLYFTEKITEYTDAYRTDYEFNDEKAKVNFVKKVERLIRMSYEYTELVKFLRQELDMTHCSFFNNISNTNNSGIKIEIHHSPFTLYDLVYIVTSKYMANEEKLEILEIAEEVMKLHFEGRIGLIPLSVTVHQLVHKGHLYVPVHFVFGNVQSFYDEYSDYMTDEQKELLEKNISVSEMMENAPELLETRFVYLEIDGMEFPKYIEKEEILNDNY